MTDLTSRSGPIGSANLDRFGIAKLEASAGKEWFNSWAEGEPRTYTAQGGTADPELALANGHHQVEIAGAEGPRSGQMRVVGDHPRIYVRASESFSIPPPIAAADMWNNVELTFYAYCTGASDVAWAGLAAAVKTNHWPDNWQCTSGGYVARMLFDGRIDFVKELYHTPNTTFYAGSVADSWGPADKSVNGRLPLHRWIGFKLLARNVETVGSDEPARVRLELFRDLSIGSDENPHPPTNGGTWALVTQYTDDGHLSHGAPCTPTSAPDDARYGDARRPFAMPNYSVYLRTDGLTEDIPQFYKWFSVREVSPIRVQAEIGGRQRK
jgi:hypothetical protein